eukprot:SAG31_NODE_4442_length_3226_cov_3.664535_1_plen_82_part_10
MDGLGAAVRCVAHSTAIIIIARPRAAAFRTYTVHAAVGKNPDRDRIARCTTKFSTIFQPILYCCAMPRRRRPRGRRGGGWVG